MMFWVEFAHSGTQRHGNLTTTTKCTHMLTRFDVILKREVELFFDLSENCASVAAADQDE